MKRNLFILTFLLLSFFLRGNCQQPVKEYEIKEVSVVRSRNDYFSTDHHSTILDSSIIHDYQSENIDKLLSAVSPVYIVSYGTSGAVATSRLRGTTGKTADNSLSMFSL
jgi:outer membrane cobalamin receptor